MSKQISSLEQHLGAEHTRGAKKIELTDVGEHYYKSSLFILDKIESVELAIQNKSDIPRGKFKITCATYFGQQCILPYLGSI